MAQETCVVNFLFVRHIELCGITPLEQAEIIVAVWIVACLALSPRVSSRISRSFCSRKVGMPMRALLITSMLSQVSESLAMHSMLLHISRGEILLTVEFDCRDVGGRFAGDHAVHGGRE